MFNVNVHSIDGATVCVVTAANDGETTDGRTCFHYAPSPTKLISCSFVQGLTTLPRDIISRGWSSVYSRDAPGDIKQATVHPAVGRPPPLLLLLLENNGASEPSPFLPASAEQS